MLHTRLEDLARHVLGDLGCLGQGPALGNESGDVGTRGQVSPVAQGFDIETNERLLDILPEPPHSGHVRILSGILGLVLVGVNPSAGLPPPSFR